MDPELARLREVADLILTDDPLRPRLSFQERRHRLTGGFVQAAERLDQCLTDASLGQSKRVGLESLRGEAHAFEGLLSSKRRAQSEDWLVSGVDLIYRIEQETVGACAPPSSVDRALLLIGRRHEADRQ
jgi:hypothetical protein